ncbi:MAG TPA: nucleotidyltransferase family protein [Rhizomicrobium sp.]|nr:nucleotidyltransferase family protein [Rhizomicrobium sp.]
MIGESAWRKTLLQADANLHDAIRCLNESALQIALVVDSEGRLLGTLTDGDVRRGLLRGLGLESGVRQVMQKEAMVVQPEMGRDMVLSLMRVNKLHQLPIVDANCRVTGLHVWDDLAARTDRPNTIVVMAGGLGTRLRPHTETCPKPLLPVAGKPMLEHIVERARLEGFSNFVFSLFYLGHMIEEHFGDGSRWNARIEYVREEKPLGTAGALGLIKPRPEVPCLVTNGDVLTDIRFGDVLDFHQRNNAAATMAVSLHEWQHPFGVVQINGIDITGFEEKPISRTHINAGIYALDPATLDLLPGAERCDMPTLFEIARQAGRRTVAFPMHEPWLDVGRPDDLKRARERQPGP